MKRVAALAACWLSACAHGGGEEARVVRGTTMGTTFTVKYFGDDSPDEVRGEIEGVLAEVNHLFSTYDEQSEISAFNAWKGTGAYPASERFVELVRLSLDVAGRTGGAFDPTMLPIVDLYGFGSTGERRVPTDKEIESALRGVGYGNLEIAEDGRLRVLNRELRLDFSAIAKGWGVDRVCDALLARGITSCMVEVGGEVRCAGAKPAGQPWTIGIEGPGRPPEIHVVDKVELRDAALATSGSYRNFLREGSRTVHHILDPRTGKNPENGVISVSVLAPTCALADALATAFMVMGSERAESVVAGYEGVKALFLVREGESGVRAQKVLWP